MKQTYLYSSPKGIRLIEGDKMPVKPVKYWGVSDALYAQDIRAYESALKLAKESSVPIQDQERAKRMIMQWLNDQPLGQGMIERDRVHGPFTVEYRIEEVFSHCTVGEKHYVKVAILYDDTPTTHNLRPCPFCGSQPEWINEAIPDSHYYIKCPHCHIVMKEDRRDKVIGMWNNRRPEKEHSGLREALREVKAKNKELRDSYNDAMRLDFRVKDSRGFPTGEVVEEAKVTPEKEESQEDQETLWREVDRIFNVKWSYGMPNHVMQELKEKFTITRKHEGKI